MAFKEQITAVGGGLLVQAPAKINLSLLIAGKRDDGFHEIETLMAKVDFYDEILIQPGGKAGIELICQGPYWAPAGNENLVYKACQMLLDSYALQSDIKITLTKNIPAESGLGSASSDAASTLLGLNKFLKLPVEPSELSQMAAELGSDVAFFLNGPLAFCTGKGEKIKKIDKKLNFLALLILPDISVSTEKVYAIYKHNLSLYKKLNCEIKAHLEKNRFDLVLKMCANMLQASCFSLHKELAELKVKIKSLGLGPLCLSGSGSAMFGIFDDADEGKARGYQRTIKREIGCTSIIVNNNRW
ncbi:MAG: 4-(cytidine 5'-diphospho)-2-C-methyl-D-erythritol kinase [Planctomycetota bacterium]|jgi:4-diphosphocytidyl-2-C-methyl-D-erythritol kinase